MIANEEQLQLILAAEDCSPEDFSRIHRFSQYEEKIIRNLVAHGPVLLRGGRGSGKSALMLEANKRLKAQASGVFSVYLSLRYLPLLRSRHAEYESIFCELLTQAANREITAQHLQVPEIAAKNVGELQRQLGELSRKLNQRVVLFFDDAAHIGRETALTEFFDIFRTISSSTVSCKASIYPGVTKFGIRFDVYNDATVLDVSRDERSSGFGDFFQSVLEARYPTLFTKLTGNRALRVGEVASFLGRAVVGNMRGFVFACNRLYDFDKIGLPELNACLLNLAADYYWPLLDELAPKLGPYEPLIDPSREIAERIFQHASETKTNSLIIHREWCQRLAKPLEILEYAGFIAKREASRGMKSGGRGPRYSLNLANLLEVTQPSRLTGEIYRNWLSSHSDIAELHTGNNLLDIELPELQENVDLAILSLPIENLMKSKAYPYGLTDNKYEILKQAGYLTIENLALAKDSELLRLDTIGEKSLDRIKSVVYQAIWM